MSSDKYLVAILMLVGNNKLISLDFIHRYKKIISITQRIRKS